MEAVLANFKIQVSEKIYVKDPESSVLGKKIIKESILLIDEIEIGRASCRERVCLYV